MSSGLPLDATWTVCGAVVPWIAAAGPLANTVPQMRMAARIAAKMAPIDPAMTWVRMVAPSFRFGSFADASDPLMFSVFASPFGALSASEGQRIARREML
jgi:hypothetical protein